VTLVISLRACLAKVIARSRRVALVSSMVLGIILTWTTSALATAIWRIDSISATTVMPGGTLRYTVDARNVGDADTDGSEIKWRIALPDGVTAVRSRLFNVNRLLPPCTAENGIDPIDGESTLVCVNAASVPSKRPETLVLTVAVGSGASGRLLSSFDIKGGGAGAAHTVDATRVGDPPEFGVDAFDGQVTGDAGDSSFTQAGGHPYAISTSIDFNTVDNTNPLIDGPYPVEAVRDLLVDLPPGLIGNPSGTAECTLAELSNGAGTIAMPLCPAAAQIGIMLARFKNVPGGSSTLGPFPVFNITPPPNVPARFGFNVLGTIVVLDAQVRSSGDYGVTVASKMTPEGIGLAGTTVTIWGVPADPTHDADRACPGRAAPASGGPTCTSSAPRTAFLRNPTSCPDPGTGLVTGLRMDSWKHPGRFVSASFTSHDPLGYPFPPDQWGPPRGTEGCARVPFHPKLVGFPGTPAKTASPSGFSFDLSLPQSDDPIAIGEGDLKKAVVTLPEGVRVSPSSAHGLGACTSQEIALRSEAEPTCPGNAKVGSVTVETPLLRDPLSGSVYLAAPHENPFDSLLAIYIVAHGPGVVVKLAGHVDADPVTGQLTTTFDDNPQVPFSRLHLEFNGGPTAPLVTPRECGDYTVQSVLESWSGKIVPVDSTFTLSHDGTGAPCPPPHFSPRLRAGTKDAVGGSTSSFHLAISRDEEDQELGGISVNMPNGLTGKIASVDLCSNEAAKAGSCPDGSLVGHVTVGAGAGTNPFYIDSGRAYLTGRYKGAPYGLAIVVPAVAGPFDLGNVVVRSSIFVDKHTAELRVVSDPLPRILEGIPLDVRDVRVNVDRHDFIVNPTSCAAKTIGSSLTSTQGATADVSARFQAVDCASLPFKPKFRIAVGDAGHTARNATVPLTTTLTMPPKSANLRYVRVTLPSTINARLTVINRACTRDVYEAGNCDAARAGTAVANTPLLRDPLHGNVYFVKNGHPLPDLFIALRGQVDFDLIGRISIPNSKFLSTTFDAIPDVPVKSFTLKLFPGARGTVGAATNLCTARARSQKAQMDFIGQNGRVSQLGQRLTIRGCAKHRKHNRGGEPASGAGGRPVPEAASTR
jgi:hypothetical protein